MGIFLKAWYSDPFIQRVYGESGRGEFDDALSRIMAFENSLATSGAVILKFWLHLGKKQQKRAFRALEADPLEAWRVTRRDWEHWKQYDEFVKVAEHLIRRTSTGSAQWEIVEGFDGRYRNLEVGTLLLKGLRRGLADEESRIGSRNEKRADGRKRKGTPPSPPSASGLEDPAMAPLGEATVLSTLDMKKCLKKAAYARAVSTLQGKLNLLRRKAREKGVAMVLVFEGWDAAGKGGAIRRVVRALDARYYQVVSVAAPTEEERAHHYLWRFWRHIPRRGRVTVFDRSWYGRVLVERIEGFATEKEWMRAYGEINDFETELVDDGIVLKKFWIHITPEEQEARFRARARSPVKSWKLTEEDWRNRERWQAYERAVSDMVERTSTRMAPWTLVEGNDKRFARVRVLEEVCEALETAVGSGRK